MPPTPAKDILFNIREAQRLAVADGYNADGERVTLLIVDGNGYPVDNEARMELIAALVNAGKPRADGPGPRLAS